MNTFYVDTRSELDSIINITKGDIAYVIDEAAKYMATSDGIWVNQTGTTSINNNYATEEFVKEEISKIEIPSIEGLATEASVEAIATDPIFKMLNGKAPSGHLLGLYIEAKQNKSLVEAMMEAGLGMYSFWIEKGCPGQPEAVIAKKKKCTCEKS